MRSQSNVAFYKNGSNEGNNSTKVSTDIRVGSGMAVDPMGSLLTVREVVALIRNRFLWTGV